MNLSNVLEQLRKELEHLDAAILSLERLQQKAAVRGRPPKALRRLNRERAQSRAALPKRRLNDGRD